MKKRSLVDMSPRAIPKIPITKIAKPSSNIQLDLLFIISISGIVVNMSNFWQEMKVKNNGEPILCLAPMADVTDSAFRHIISKYSSISHVTYTEFVSADGLCLAPLEGRKKLLKDLEFSEIERPIVAQFFTSKPENMERVARLAAELGFDGVDINMGCPDKSIEKQGAGAALIKNPKLARELIRAAKIGVQNKIPVSVKTRLGYNKDELDPPADGWLPELLAEEPAAIILHARTRKEMSLVPARWERIKRAVEIRDNLKSETLILGNGDVVDTDDARRKCRETGADGAMLGRAVFGNACLFSNHKPNLEEKLQILKEHIQLFHKNLGQVKSFAIMKKHFKAYLAGYEGVFDLKNKLMETNNAEEAVSLINALK
ncbi:MAG TPA: tRNA-dihydrouridine synthase [Candidatus Paceibacterota bacterium]